MQPFLAALTWALLTSLPFQDGHAPSAESLQTAARFTAAGYTRVRLVSVLQTGNFYVPVEVEGKRTRLLVDTGAMTGLQLTRKFADAAGLECRRVPNRFIAGVGGGQLPVWTASPRSLRLDTFTVPPMPVDVGELELGMMEDMLDKAGGYGGLIGSGLLAYYSAVIDYGGSQMFLIDPLDRERWVQGDWTVATVAGSHPALPVVAGTAVKVVRHAFYLTRDGVTTGYGMALLPNERPKQFNLTAADGKIVSGAYRQTADGALQLAIPPADKPRVNVRFDPAADNPCTVVTLTRPPNGKK